MRPTVFGSSGNSQFHPPAERPKVSLDRVDLGRVIEIDDALNSSAAPAGTRYRLTSTRLQRCTPIARRGNDDPGHCHSSRGHCAGARGRCSGAARRGIRCRLDGERLAQGRELDRLRRGYAEERLFQKAAKVGALGDARREEQRRLFEQAELANTGNRKPTRRALMLAPLILLLASCASELPTWSPPLEPAAISPLPAEAKQPAIPSMCLPSCSAA